MYTFFYDILYSLLIILFGLICFVFFFFFFYCYGDHRDLHVLTHSFPTRRSSDRLFVSQPAVTQQLQALERELGVRLFERSGRRLVPTREGETLYELARPLVEGIDGLGGVFREKLRGLDAGELHVAAGSSTILYLLPKIVEAFRAAQPDVRLILHNVTGAGGLDLLRSDEVDLAVGSMLDVPADLDYAPVYRFDPM